MADWTGIRTEYISTNISYRNLADKHGVPFPTLRDRAKKEEWSKLRKETRDKQVTVTLQKTQDAIVKKELRRIDRIYAASDKLLDKLDRAIDELNLHLVTNKTRTRVIEYKDSKALGKPTKEVIEDIEQVLQMAGIVDRAGLKNIASALKDIKDIQGLGDTKADEDTSSGREPLAALTTEELKALAQQIDGSEE